MKRAIIVALLAALTLTACGGRGTSRTKDSKGKTEKVSNKDKENANAIIGYTNGIIDYLNETGSWLRSNDGRIEDALNVIENQRWSNVLPLTPNPSIGFKDKGLDTPPAAMEKEDQQYFKSTIAEYRTQFTALQEDVEKLRKYIQNQDYKDDDYAKGQELAEKIIAEYNYVVDTKSEMYGRIDDATYDAEYIILSDHTLRDPIFTLKDEITNFQELYNVFYGYNEGEATAEEAEAKYQSVFADVEKNRVLYADVLEEYGETSSYKNFYDKCEDALSTYRFSLRTYVKEGRKIPSNELRSFSSNHNRLISSYNSLNN